MKQPPKKPKRKTRQTHIGDIHFESSGVSFKTLKRRIQKHGGDPDECYLIARLKTLTIYQRETLPDYEKRLAKYREKVVAYEKWSKQHAEECYTLEEEMQQEKINKQLAIRSRKKRKLKVRLEKIRQTLTDLEQQEIKINQCDQCDQYDQ